ncbi:hypothetical protein BJF92_14050 [Rhizobium rhizosphaerae]|uniref:Phage tail tube protein, GTA-gp10 n=1 Tax=Xaviernesmea rhizosphaerae TaxID=1672749 RepID=A0A1Q9AI76_9HYPH|nr:gene transfer agent family protein [Xaviernesmea rhizosphaerae]OLP54917.1 hypothetical protein BJF92_14050 [Xaviernesmea rhizosphaerae]
MGAPSRDPRRANRQRGEIEAVLGGERRVLCLTLGSLAELETAFGVAGLAALAARFGQGQLAARDLIHLLGAGLRGAGADISDEEVAAMTMDGGLAPAADAVSALLAAAFGLPASPETSPDPVPDPPQDP